MSARILVVGDVMLDRYWFGKVERISPEAPVPIVKIDHCEERLGGAANVAKNIAALGMKVSLLGVAGEDEAGNVLDALLDQAQIHRCLNRDPAISTIVKLRIMSQQQQLLRVDFEDAPTNQILQNKLHQYHQLLPDHDVVIFSDYAKGALANVSDMITACLNMKKTVLVDPKGSDFARYRGATVLTPNKTELRQIIGSWTNEAELTEKAHNLRQHLKLHALLVTRSEEGMSLYTDELTHHVPTTAREVFDVSGAGDTVIATLGAMLALGKNLLESVEIANRAAGIVVGKLGTATVAIEELFSK